MKNIIGTDHWEKTGMDVFWGEIAPSDHILQIYDDDAEFIDILASYVSSGFNSGESVVIIATPEHLKSLNQRLRDQGYDLFSLTLQDQYIPLNAKETLEQFMINGWPDENLFFHLLTTLLLRARKKVRPVRAFGEMVALLWSQGYSGATVHLEHLWTRFCQLEQFRLFCAYPKVGFTENAVASIIKICGCHNKIIASSNDGSAELFSYSMANSNSHGA
ncbi:MAG: MEDS domain-containing protein [Cyclobacteriaceae bacterium]